MNNFSYTRPTQLKDALADYTAQSVPTQFLGGGTNLVDLMKANVVRPLHVIDLSQLSSKTIEPAPGGGLRLGAGVTNAATAYDDNVRTRYPLLAQAILAGASPQLRNMATNGGNLLQRTRCYYFYDTATPCNKRDPGTGCGAIEGVNRIHAILGQSENCIATHPSDMCIALAALAVTVNVTGPTGERQIAFADFHRLPGDMPQIDTNLKPGEVITSIDLPPEGFASNYSYVKLRDRASYAFALVSVAVGLKMDGPIVSEARIALGGVAHKPWRKAEAESLLVGKPIDAASTSAAAAALLEGAKGYEHNAFKIELARRAIPRALAEAAAGPASSPKAPTE